MPKQYTTITIPTTTAADINKLKIAVGFQTGRICTFEQLFSEMLSSLEKTNPALMNIFRNINGNEMKIL